MSRCVTLHGDVELTRDRKGPALAKEIKAAVDAVVKALPEAIQTVKPQTVKNPFG